MAHATALFLDRDGVINQRIMGGYVTRWEDFHFLPGVLEALVLARTQFDYIFIVTNQQGVGKGLMTATELATIHQQMLASITQTGGKIDHIFTCTALASAQDPNRKPDIGMALQAKARYPSLDLSRSVMVGDTRSDLLFAHKAGMAAIWIDHNTGAENAMPPFNYRCGSLFEAIQWWTNNSFADHEKG